MMIPSRIQGDQFDHCKKLLTLWPILKRERYLGQASPRRGLNVDAREARDFAWPEFLECCKTKITQRKRLLD